MHMIEQNQPYLLCAFNREGSSHRSPWSNLYFPPAPSPSSLFYPSHYLRSLEVKANAAFQIYRELYYDGQGVSSVYLWELSDEDADISETAGAATTSGSTASPRVGFAGCFAIKKGVLGDRSRRHGTWDATHVVEVQPLCSAVGRADILAHYKLTSTIQVSLFASSDESEDVCAACVITKFVEATHPVVESTGGHISNVGRMIEDLEIKLRGDLGALYLQRTCDIVEKVRRSSATTKSKGGGVYGENSAEGTRARQRPAEVLSVGQASFSSEHQKSLFAAIARRNAERESNHKDYIYEA